MTISSEVRKAGPFAGNGATTSFPFLFKVFTSADVGVVVADVLGAEAPLVEGVDYTVSLSANQDVSPGGSVATTVPVAVGDKLVIFSQVRSLQPTDLSNQGGFYPAVINAALDRAIILIQQLSEKIDRSAKLPITRTEDADSLLADVVLLAENIAFINTVASNIGNVNTVSGVSADVTTVAGISADVSTVAGVSSDIPAVALVASDIPAVAASSVNVDLVGGSIANVNTVAGSIGDVNAVVGSIVDVVAVAAAIADIQAALADLPALAAKVSKTGDTMTGHLSGIPGATGAQFPQVQEVIWSTPVKVAAAGTSFDVTGIPSTAKEIKVSFHNVAYPVSGGVTIRFGSGGVFPTTAYSTSLSAITGGGSIGSALAAGGIVLRTASGAAGLFLGEMTLFKTDSLLDRWSVSGAGFGTSDDRTIFITGVVANPLDTLRFLMAGGSFSSGDVYISWRK